MLDSFRVALAQSPARGADAEARNTLLEAALRDGLPGLRDEAWKYTPLRALERRGFAPAPAAAPAIDPALLADIPAPRLVFVNGRHAAALSDLS
ncbi:MAG TPA: Fe-S cluster assembly protein SufD, partial [Xanthomonadaceae bacterium]|nr:Fe-S cluster assembly protein SufD [Xanthomonadaceae bacterium]